MGLILAVPTAISAAVVAVILRRSGLNDDSVVASLLASARVALAVFLVVFVARPLRDLLPFRWPRSLVAYRKWLGLSFALAMLFHVFLIVTLYAVHAPAPPPEIAKSDFVLGGPGLVAIALLSVLSNNAIHRRMGQRSWRAVNLVGIAWVWTVFVMCFVAGAPARGEDTHSPYLWIPLGLLLVAMAIRVAASLANAVRRRSPGAWDLVVLAAVVGAYLLIGTYWT